MILNIFITICLISLITSFIALKSFNILPDIQKYLLYIFFIVLFWFIGKLYEDSYSIERLIHDFQLSGYGTVDYKILVSKNNGPYKCKINGKYGNDGRLNYELDHNNLYCREIIKETNNLSPIAQWDEEINLDESGTLKINEDCENNKCGPGLICSEEGYLSNINEDIEFSNKCKKVFKLI